jgi:hypothetical protein
MAKKPSKACDPREIATPKPEPATPPPDPASALRKSAQEFLKVVAKARAGDAKVLPRLRRVLDQHPEVWRFAGDLARLTQKSWINQITGDPLMAESIIRQAAAMKADLEGPAPTPLERLLVDQVIASWLETQSSQFTLTLPEQTLRQARHHVHHADVAQRKYLAAVKALTTVRTLQPSALTPTTPLKIFDKGRKQA